MLGPTSPPEYGAAVIRAALGWALGLALYPTLAHAQVFQCTPADTDGPRLLTQVWTRSNRCLPYYINERSELFASAEGQLLVAESFAVWSSLSCTDLEFRSFGTTGSREGFSPSSSTNENVILETTDREEIDPDVLATTLTFHSSESGEIFDADIIFNSARFDFREVTSTDECLAAGAPIHDVRNTLVHEIGHFIGFDHNPDRFSTMFATAPACETQKQELNSIDIEGLCSVYPSGLHSSTCSPADDYDDISGNPSRFRNQCRQAEEREGGCQAIGGGTGTGLWWMVGLFAWVRRQQRLNDR